MKDHRAEYERWCAPPFDLATREELGALTDEEEIEDRFYRELAFGTGGLRGKLGAGTNRMNVYTVGRATQGLADFLNARNMRGGVAIAYDSRMMSPEFALDSALILAANGIKAYLFEGLRPTPELSFAVREHGCSAGIVITASHNPPAYNGYKVYLADGGQIVPPYDGEIISCVNAVKDYFSVGRISEREAIERGLLCYLGKETDDRYFAALKKLSLSPITERGKKLKIVYTPLNGTGNLPVRRVLKEMGFENVWVVPEQEAPDGRFPTLGYPNPEEPKAFEYALRLAKEKDADLVLATDPDADRLGVYAKDEGGEYRSFTGNMSGLLLAEYLLSRREALGLLPARRRDGALVTTIVSSDMAKEIANAYGLTLIETLTGFKYIGEQIARFEEAHSRCGAYDGERGAYLFEYGFEESYGCLAGTYARDKDAVAAVALLAEAAAWYAEQGLTLPEQMERLYRKYGYFRETLFSATLTGANGAQEIGKMMCSLRTAPPVSLGGSPVLAVRDYLSGTKKTAQGEERLSLPKSDVLYFELGNGWCCVRPSGTEPKIKFYAGAKGASAQEADETVSRIKDDLLGIVYRKER